MIDDNVMEKFVLVPEVCPVVPMTSAAEPTLLAALSEVHSPVVLAGGGGGLLWHTPGQWGYATDTVRVSVLQVVGSELLAFFAGKVASDVVGLSVGPSCLRVDSEETLPALLDERSVMSCTVLGVILDGGPIEGPPVLEPIEHSFLEKSLDGGDACSGTDRAFGSGDDPGRWTYGGGEGAVLEPLEHLVLEKSLDGGPMEGMTVLEPLEHLVLEIALDGELIEDLSVLEPLEHSVLEMTLDGGPIESGVRRQSL